MATTWTTRRGSLRYARDSVAGEKNVTTWLADDEVGQMLRADPALDPTIGFFAVVLERSLDAQDPVAAHPPHGLLSPPPSDTDVVPATLHRRRDDDVRRRSKRWQAGGRWRGIRPGRLVVG